jgi:hypothetical protein
MLVALKYQTWSSGWPGVHAVTEWMIVDETEATDAINILRESGVFGLEISEPFRMR